jgi:hypothetical protein
MTNPIEPPTCWQFFGLNGPTNKHNLDLLYRDRLNSIAPAGCWNAMSAAYVCEQYQKCLLDING